MSEQSDSFSIDSVTAPESVSDTPTSLSSEELGAYAFAESELTPTQRVLFLLERQISQLQGKVESLEQDKAKLDTITPKYSILLDVKTRSARRVAILGTLIASGGITMGICSFCKTPENANVSNTLFIIGATVLLLSEALLLFRFLFPEVDTEAKMPPSG